MTKQQTPKKEKGQKEIQVLYHTWHHMENEKHRFDFYDVGKSEQPKFIFAECSCSIWQVLFMDSTRIPHKEQSQTTHKRNKCRSLV